jgi:D-aminopeptidase
MEDLVLVSTVDSSCLQQALDILPVRFKGPGGVAGVVKDGYVLARQAWGYADLATGKALTTSQRMPICSISKQFTCGVLLDTVGDPTRLDGRLADFFPDFESRLPSVENLCNMQSGLRDYWALTVVQGAHPDGLFRREDARALLAHMRTPHFEPGSSYSYSNGNFRVLSDLLEEHTDRSLAELYRDRIFEPANMETAVFSPDTSERVDGTIGYEGNHQTGFFPAINRIYWTGDAGINASLEDMLAWEQYIDATREDAQGIYRRLSQPQMFQNGATAWYGYGLSHERVSGFDVTGHGGALRGFRLQRLYMPSQRLSVVVLFNHEADAHEAARMLLRAALGDTTTTTPTGRVDPGWNGHYLIESSGHLLDIEANGGALDVRYATHPDKLQLYGGNIAKSPTMTLIRDGDSITLECPGENLITRATRVAGEADKDLEGRYYSRELEATLEIEMTGTALFGRFDGLLGCGPMHAIYPVGRDVFVLSCQRSMDAPAPGNWTIQIRRDAAGSVDGLVVGCWLARNITYERR